MDWIGTVTGVAALVISGLAYRRSISIKRLELRVEARTLTGQLHEDVKDLPEKLRLAQRSREAVDAATGMLGSGAAQRWLTGREEDSREQAAILVALPPAQATFSGHEAEALESMVVSLRLLTHRAAALRAKLDADMRDDDDRRERLRSDRLRVPRPAPIRDR